MYWLCKWRKFIFWKMLSWIETNNQNMSRTKDSLWYFGLSYCKIQADKTNDLSKDWHEPHWLYDSSCLNMEIYWDKLIFVLSVIVKKSLSWQLSWSSEHICCFLYNVCTDTLLDHQKWLGRDWMSQNLNHRPLMGTKHQFVSIQFVPTYPKPKQGFNCFSCWRMGQTVVPLKCLVCFL